MLLCFFALLSLTGINSNYEFQYLSNTLVQKEYSHEFSVLDAGLSRIGLSDDQKMHLYKALALILHIGNIDFDSDEDNGKCTISSNSFTSLNAAAQLLNIAVKEFENFLLTRPFKVSASSIASSTE